MYQGITRKPSNSVICEFIGLSFDGENIYSLICVLYYCWMFKLTDGRGKMIVPGDIILSDRGSVLIIDPLPDRILAESKKLSYLPGYIRLRFVLTHKLIKFIVISLIINPYLSQVQKWHSFVSQIRPACLQECLYLCVVL